MWIYSLIITDNTAYGVFGHVSSGQTVVDLIPCFTNMLVIIVHCDYILSFCWNYDKIVPSLSPTVN